MALYECMQEYVRGYTGDVTEDVKDDMYDGFTISYIAKLSMEHECALIDEKKKVCLMLDSIPFKDMNYLYKWSYGKNGEIILKPQYLHSAAKIYLLLKCSQLQGNASFVEKVTNSGLEVECLSIALDVLRTDSDHMFYINYFDNMMRVLSDFYFV